MCETSPLARVPSTASLWMVCEITPLVKRSPNLPSYPHVLRIALFWDAREPCFSLYAFQPSTWYKCIQNVADLLLISMVIFSPTRGGHESVPWHAGTHIGRSRALVGHESMPQFCNRESSSQAHMRMRGIFMRTAVRARIARDVET